MSGNERERQALLARQTRGPLERLAELARCVTDKGRPAEERWQEAQRLLARDFGVRDARIEWALGEAAGPPSNAQTDRIEARASIVRRGARIGLLRAELREHDEPAGLDSIAHRVLELALELCGELASELCGELASELGRGPLPAVGIGAHDLGAPLVMLGRSAAALELRRAVAGAASCDVPLVLHGEAGSGHELVARAIHASSARAGQPLWVLDAHGSSEQLASLTQSQAARGGVLLVDEVAALRPELQAELSQLIAWQSEQPSVERAVRVIGATRVDLLEAVKSGRVRKDLYYRLHRLAITLPPLRCRRADVPVLAGQLLAKHSGLLRKSVTRISEPALELLAAYDFPGNLHELESVIARAVLLSHFGVIRQHHLPPALQPSLPGGSTVPSELGLDASVEAFERRLIVDALEAASGNRTRAARVLGTTPRVLSYRIRKLGL